MNRTHLVSTVVLLLATQLQAATTTSEPSVNPVSSINPVESINCSYQIPPQTTQVDINLLKQWADYAASQSFHLSYNTLDQDINQLKPCFTEQGFTSFKNALEISGNITTINNQKLNVSGIKNGDSSVEVLKDGRWQVTVPLQVNYQNDQEKMTQELSVILLIERKPTGQFGIVQMNAKAKTPEDNHPTTTNTAMPATQPASATLPAQTGTPEAVPGTTDTTQTPSESDNTSPTSTIPTNNTVTPTPTPVAPNGTTPTTNINNAPQTSDPQTTNNINSGTE